MDTITQGAGIFIRSSDLVGEIFEAGNTLEIRYSVPVGLSMDLLGGFFLAKSEQIVLYPLRRIVYDAVSGVPNPETAFNIEDLTQKRMLQRHYSWLNGVNYNLAPDSITFQTLDRNQELVTILNGLATIENASLPVSTLGNPMFYPFLFSFKTKVPLNFAAIMNGAANGHIQFTYNGVDLYGFPLDVSQQPALNESQVWKLLCSPLTDLSDLVNLDIDGLNYLDMPGLSAFISHACPVHFVKLNFQNPSKYHTATMDQDWFKNRITKWAANNDYFNPWQNDDTIRLQCLTNGLGPVTVDMLNCKAEIVGSYELDVKASNAVKSPYILYEGNIPLLDIPEDVYYLLLKAGTGTAIVNYISEPLWIRESWPETILFEYSNKVNKQAMIFDTGYNPSLRVEGRIGRYEPGSHFATYENQPADIEMMDGIAFDTYNLEIGYHNGGVPDYKIRKIARIMLLSDTYIDGTAYTRNGDSKFDRTNFPGQPREYWSLGIRPRDNRDGITVSTEGTIDTNISIVYNIQGTAYGDNSGVSNVFQVTEENQ
ncbi:hypothetical protein [Paraflavitalea speifideaquila]|uniref:hypothetical protein n=1 Tax=Paraflavitalea speifideaquila TaxID=3076558 RepID=UPI0028EFCD04|nr:hypothetical protein [Paraflavitalea speifideiaquila]